MGAVAERRIDGLFQSGRCRRGGDGFRRRLVRLDVVIAEGLADHEDRDRGDEGGQDDPEGRRRRSRRQSICGGESSFALMVAQNMLSIC